MFFNEKLVFFESRPYAYDASALTMYLYFFAATVQYTVPYRKMPFIRRKICNGTEFTLNSARFKGGVQFVQAACDSHSSHT